MIRRLAPAVVAAALAGCMVGPDYERPAMELPAAYPAAQAPAGTTEAVLRADWWKLYNDPLLDELIASSLERNADIRLAVARIEEADANLREANAAFLPEIDAQGSANRSRSSTTTGIPVPAGIPATRNDIRLALSTAFELDFWGRLRRAAEALRAQALGSRYARDVVGLTLAGLTTQAYFGLRSLDAQLLVTRETLANREESLAYVRKRAAGGIASDLELAQAEAARAAIAVQLRELQRQRALLERQLAVLAGRLDLGVGTGDLRALPVPALPPAGLPSALLERRPDVRQAEQQLVSTNAQIGIARAAMFPTISLTGALGAQSQALSTLNDTGSRIWSLGFGLSLPIFDSGRYAARTDAARARERQAVAGYQKTIETAFREVSDALATVESTSSAEQDYQTQLDAARRALRLARLRYESGYSAFLEVLDAQRTANDAELAYLRNRQALLSATVDLMKALGGGWSAERVSLSR
jgi:outer membrane protein, multidrug efflux system